MCLSYHNTCYQFIGYVKITIADSFVMPLVFAFRTSLQEGFFSRDGVEMVYILSLYPSHSLDYDSPSPF
jgi:hypothetical protein